MASESLRFPVRVKPRAPRVSVGGTWGPQRVLLVTVQVPAVDGKANRAVIGALAGALELPKQSVSIVGGERSRNKFVEVANPPSGFSKSLNRLLAC